MKAKAGRPALAATTIAMIVIAGWSESGAYPLDGSRTMGIRRLLGHQNVQAGKVPGQKLPAGALLSSDEIRLSLAGGNPGWDLEGVAKDPTLQSALASIFEDRDPSYAVAVVDLSDPEHPVWAGLREDRTSFPGSVGKVVCMAALFDGLRRAFPDVADRERVLRETVVEATDWAQGDWHPVPTYDPETGSNRSAPIRGGERFTLAEWVDHMISASANSAGAIVWKEAMLLRRFGAEYPVGPEREEEFFRTTPKRELAALSLRVGDDPLLTAGLDPAGLRQGTFWTKAGQRRVPGSSSYASPRELARFLIRIEEGRMVDPWSSLEMKRYLYMTRRRFRFAYAPELREAAVYFKSGSYYRCAPEPGYRCAKYAGNVENTMNSIAIVESPAAQGPGQRRYIVALTSNVLRKNSAWDHARLAAAIEEAVRTRKPTKAREGGTEADISAAGKD